MNTKVKILIYILVVFTFISMAILIEPLNTNEMTNNALQAVNGTSNQFIEQQTYRETSVLIKTWFMPIVLIVIGIFLFKKEFVKFFKTL